MVSPSTAHQTLQDPLLNTVYLDVRMPSEFQNGHAPGAINVPVTLGGGVPVDSFVADVMSKLAALPPQNLIVGCKSGKRSTLAINLLSQDNSFKGRMDELDGGFDNWVTSGLPVSM